MNEAMTVRRLWRPLKEKHPDAIVLLRLGDFYEAYDEDARTVSDTCDVVLTSRRISDEVRLPMAGIPAHTAEERIGELVQAGHRVVVSERVGQRTIHEPEQLAMF